MRRSGPICAGVRVSGNAVRSEGFVLPGSPRTPARPLHPFVFRHGRIGDMVMMTAVLRALHERYGAPCYLVGMDPWIHDMYRDHPDVAACWHLPRKAPFAFGLAWPSVVRALRRSTPGPVYVFEHHRREVPRIRRLLALSGIDPRRCLYIDQEPGTERLWLDVLLEFAARTPAGVPGRWCSCSPATIAPWVAGACVTGSSATTRPGPLITGSNCCAASRQRGPRR